MKKLMLASLILASSQMAMAVNWVPLQYANVYKDNYYIDFDSVRGNYFNIHDKSNFYVTAWTKTVYSEYLTFPNGKQYNRLVALEYIDCIRDRATISEIHRYSISGNSVGSTKTDINIQSSDSWDKIIPDTAGYALAKEICSIYQFKQFYQK